MAHAATPLKLLAFLRGLLYPRVESESFARWLASNSPAELMAVLSTALRARVVAEPAEREVLRQLLPGLQVVSAADLRTLPDDDGVWLWDSQPLNGELVPVGKPVDPARLAAIPSGDPLRLLRRRELWTRCLEADSDSVGLAMDLSVDRIMTVCRSFASSTGR